MEGTELGLFNNFRPFTGERRKTRQDAAHRNQTTKRRCHFEKMEPRQLLDADPVIAGITYLEDDLGQDTTPDYFEVTFQGGADTTQMTQFVLNGDQDLSGGLSNGDMFFDVDGSLPGAGHSHGFQFHAGGSVGINANDILGVSVSDDGLMMTVNVRNFDAGDKLAFTIDVDEVEQLRNDKIASGVEFEGTHFEASFVDENYTFENRDIDVLAVLDDGQPQQQSEGTFYDEYDLLLAEGEAASNGLLDLVRDNEQGQADRNAGAVDAYDLVPKPIEISGTVYHDENLNCEHDGNEDGIEGVLISLQKFNDNSGQYETVATTTTDANGDYSFGRELGLTPGKFRLIEDQPSGYLDVGASAGTVEGTEDGIVATDADNNKNIIGDIDIPLGGTAAENYDFKEVLPATIAGNVYHDRNDDGNIDPGEEGIANVLIQVTRIGAKDASIDDPFASTEPIFVRTDANGHYEVTGLPPGIYEVTEINNYPVGSNPLVDFVDGKDTVGTIGGLAMGDKINDQFNTIELCAGDDGIEYNFGELKPASISGFVTIATPEGDCLDPTDPNHRGIAGVEVQLFDSNGNLVASTLTDDNGQYEFENLNTGTYTIVEVQPDGYLDGAESIGRVEGELAGLNPVNDRFVNVSLGSGEAGTMYNFCEHLPASVKGYVWYDLDNNGGFDTGERGIEGVVIELYDADGALVAQTTTDADGRYCFDDLYAGEYKIVETQPSDYIDGKESLGSVAGTASGEIGEDEFCYVNLLEGEQGDHYNFGEIRLGSIAGTVHGDVNGDCTFDPAEGDMPLEGVVLELLDVNGEVIATTKTDANGNYAFTGLVPGEYSVREYTPDGYVDGEEMVGTVNGESTGKMFDDLLAGIVLTSGQNAVDYDFCEHVPAQLKGSVWYDVNNDGVRQSGEKGIEGVVIQLFDADDNLVSEVVTDADGRYCFENLVAGEYKVRELQPGDYVDGKESLGGVDGALMGKQENDAFCNIVLKGGQTGENYDFGEIRLASIEGFVHLDPNGDCVYNTFEGDEPLIGAKLQLLDANGNVIGQTVTDIHGHYQFDNLLPGTYSVREIQPEGVFTTGERIGTGGGNSAENIITDIVVESGQKLVNYNFCEQEGAEIHGRVWEDGPAFKTSDGQVPDGYRGQRDGVYDPSVDTPLSGVRMELWYYIDPVSNEIAPRPVTLGEVLGDDYGHLGNDPNAAVWVETMQNGEYWFTGLKAGNYIVVESQPGGYVDANDTPGSTTGFVFNSEAAGAVAPNILLSTFSSERLLDSIVNIRVNAGDVSIQNNFSEVRAISEPGGPGSPPPPIDQPPTPTPPSPPLNPGLGLAGNQSINYVSVIGGGRGLIAVGTPEVGLPYTWHLSVVNAGHPRGETAVDQPIWLQASYLSQQDWNRFDMDAGEWTFTTADEDGSIDLTSERSFFGMIDGIPLAGDFNGDGVDEIAVYKDGYWMIDLNGNGQWDSDDLMARLGNEDDRPVVGDWDGDGKEDIGIFGPIWEGDDEAIEAEPGLPDPDNDPMTRPKNVPPRVVEAAEGARAMRLSSFGTSRMDVIDHVFGYGDEDDTPVVGDWNGDSIRSIGIFRDGQWQIDLNADGQLNYHDDEFTFGRAGDLPLVGDFNGDGIEEVAIYRNGTWIIDSNGNREIDATDMVFEMGGRGDVPVVGDWNGDGVDEPAIYQSGATEANSRIQ
ncbi:MAG: SdrD B-like domain-containing protein [Pirellulaceae bacterium]